MLHQTTSKETDKHYISNVHIPDNFLSRSIIHEIIFPIPFLFLSARCIKMEGGGGYVPYTPCPDILSFALTGKSGERLTTDIVI